MKNFWRWEKVWNHYQNINKVFFKTVNLFGNLETKILKSGLAVETRLEDNSM